MLGRQAIAHECKTASPAIRIAFTSKLFSYSVLLLVLCDPLNHMCQYITLLRQCAIVFIADMWHSLFSIILTLWYNIVLLYSAIFLQYSNMFAFPLHIDLNGITCRNIRINELSERTVIEENIRIIIPTCCKV
jgi:hypothetical protein